jgi:replicative DNA helicase
MNGRALPSTLDAERVVLGAVIDSNSLAFESAALLKPEDFAEDRHRRIFCRLIEMAQAGKPIDLISLTHAMTGANEIEDCGGVAYISDLDRGLVRRSSITHHAGIVLDCAKRRRLVWACEAAIERACDSGIEISDSSQAISDALLEIEARSADEAFQSVARFSDDVFASIGRMRERTEALIGLTTGIDSLDLITTGLRPGELWLLGGWPGEGKSSLALQLVSANIAKETPVALFTVEMDRAQVLTRIWAQHGNLPFDRLRDPRRLSADEFERLHRVKTEVSKMPLYVDDSSSITIDELAARARLMVRRHNIRLVVIDYIQLIDGNGKDERQRVSRISRALRELAKEGVPVLALSQLSRPKDGNLNTRPNKFSLKESGSLEADAHTVLLIYRPVDQQGQPFGEDEIIVAKQRNGPWSIEPVWFDKGTLVYRERVQVSR